jgi:hypothetical protein
MGKVSDCKDLALTSRPPKSWYPPRQSPLRWNGSGYRRWFANERGLPCAHRLCVRLRRCPASGQRQQPTLSRAHRHALTLPDTSGPYRQRAMRVGGNVRVALDDSRRRVLLVGNGFSGRRWVGRRYRVRGTQAMRKDDVGEEPVSHDNEFAWADWVLERGEVSLDAGHTGAARFES